MKENQMKVECLYKVGDTVNVKGHNTPMLVTGFVLDDNECVSEYELVPTAHIIYCTENAIEGLSNDES